MIFQLKNKISSTDKKFTDRKRNQLIQNKSLPKTNSIESNKIIIKSSKISPNSQKKIFHLKETFSKLNITKKEKIKKLFYSQEKILLKEKLHFLPKKIISIKIQTKFTPKKK